MLFTYDKANKKVGRYQTTDFAKHKILERQTLEKWVEEDPDILGEELMVLTTEYDKFDKTDERLDLLALDKEGNLVVVELKRDDSGKTMELQAIKYAAYCSTLTFDDIVELHQEYLTKKGIGASQESVREKLTSFVSEDFEALNDRPRIILVSREYRPEVTASVIWLRKFDLDISCVKLTPYELDKNTIAIESSTIIPVPEAEEYIIKAEKKERAEHTLSVSQQEYVAFYKDISGRIKRKLPISFTDPTGKSYFQIPTGISRFHFEWGFHGRPRNSFGVELHFEKGNRDANQAALHKCESLRAEIEKQTGEPVVFQKEWGRAWSRLYIEKKEGAMTEELKVWAVEKMEELYRVLQPTLTSGETVSE